jgi:hypothetical protein
LVFPSRVSSILLVADGPESYSQYHGPDQDLRAWAGELKKLLKAARDKGPSSWQ